MATVAPERGRTNKGVISHVLGAINAVRRQNSGQPIASRDSAALIKVASLLKDGSAG